MNDIPVEMSFDGAGFLRYEDDSDEDKSTHYSKSRNSNPKQEKTNQDNTQAINDFRAAFNVSTVRMPNQIKYDDEVPYQNEVPSNKNFEEKLPDHGAQAQNGVPFAVDFMTAFQHGMFANPPVKYSPHPTQIPQQPAYDPFQFYQNMFSNQATTNTMLPTTSQQDPFLQNHRVPVLTNTDAVSQNAMYSQIPQQFMSNPTNPVYVPNVNMQQYHKKQRRKRSVSLVDSGNIVTSQASEDHYRYSGEDRQAADSGFLPITGTYNNGAIQLNFPYYGQSPMHSPVQAVSAYSMPVNQEARYYGNPVERFYYPSEARRYSYGVLGSGNFEVIRGGLFPNERPRQNYHGGYPDSRAPYISNSFPNYGTTEIIIDGPLQGFQGFDNFNVQLINALSKHSELAVKPDHRDRHDLST